MLNDTLKDGIKYTPVLSIKLVNQLYTFGKFTLKAAITAIVEEQTNAAELDRPEPRSMKAN